MDMSLNIEGFNDLLTSGKGDTPMLTALRKLTTLEKPEDIVKLAADPTSGWGGGWSVASE